MRSLVAHLLLISALTAELHLHITKDGDSLSLPLSKCGTLTFENGSLVESKTGSTIPLEEISGITFPLKDIDPILSNSSLVSHKGAISMVDSKVAIDLGSLHHNKKQSVTLFLVSLQGRVLVKEQLHAQTASLQVELGHYSLASGVYTLICNSGTRAIVDKVVIK